MMKQIILTLVLLTGLTVNATTENTTAVETAPVVAVTETQAVEATAPVSTTPISAAEAAKLNEDQIPLSIGATKKAAESASGTTKALMSMLIVLVLIASTYYFVRRYKFSNTINKSNTRIQVLSQHFLGPKKSLAIIHVAGESILVGITDQNISMIKSLSLIDDEVPADTPNSFGQTMSQVETDAAGAVQTVRTKQVAQANKAFELDEEFSFANVTDSVSKKIKSMRSIS
jgi:flagellar protein FliO/FliZ